MKDYFAGPDPAPPPQQLRAGRSLGIVGRTLLIAAAVALLIGGLAVAGLAVLVVAGLNSWGSNK